MTDFCKKKNFNPAKIQHIKSVKKSQNQQRKGE